MFYKRWTDEEVKVIKSLYGIKTPYQLSLLLGKTVSDVMSKAKQLKLTKSRSHNESMDRLEDEFDGGCYYKMLDYAKTLDSSIEYVTDAYAKYGRCEFEMMYKKYKNG